MHYANAILGSGSGGQAMGKIIWMASYPKSGNTWLRAFLHNFLRNPKETYDLNRLSDYSLGDSHGGFYQKFLRKPLKEMADAIDTRLRALGYAHVTVDLRGYRLGSLNEALRLRQV